MAKGKKENLYGKLIARALKDEVFRKRLKKNPEETIKNEFGIEIPSGMKIKIIEDSETLKHFVIPKFTEGAVKELTDADLEMVAAAGAAPHTGQKTLACDTAWQTCWICS